MIQLDKCKNCGSEISFNGNFPFPVELDCFHKVCLPCVN